MGKQNTELFSSREKIRKWKSFSGVLHLVTVSSLVLSLLWILPRLTNKSAFQISQEMQQEVSRRQLLLEAMDKMARYQKYYNEVHGRFTRDITRLSLPDQLSLGKQEILKRDYEISVLEVRPNRFVLLATGTNNSDRVTIDESHRVNANFVLPSPSRAYLIEEADRILHLRAAGAAPDEGVFARYWDVKNDEAQSWVAVGKRVPVLGERREASADNGDSIFASVRERVQNRMSIGPMNRTLAATEAPVVNPFAYKEELDAHDVSEWLETAHLAQHVYLRERGHFAKRWEDLDEISDYHFSERMRVVKNVRVHPIDLVGGGYQLTLEGTAGDLMGEQFVVDKSGSVRQVRYTEALIQQLQETTNILENFQINPIVDDAASKHQP